MFFQFPADAKRCLSRFKSIVLVGCRVPVAMFGYEDGISTLLGDQNVVFIDDPDLKAPLAALLSAVQQQVGGVYGRGAWYGRGGVGRGRDDQISWFQY